MTAADARVDVLWWLLTGAGLSIEIHQPGDPIIGSGTLGNVYTEFSMKLGDSRDSTVRAFAAPTRDQLLDRLVGVMVEEKLS